MDAHFVHWTLPRRPTKEIRNFPSVGETDRSVGFLVKNFLILVCSCFALFDLSLADNFGFDEEDSGCNDVSFVFIAGSTRWEEDRASF